MLSIYNYKVRYSHSSKLVENPRILESVCFGSAFSSNSKYYDIYILKGDADLNKYISNFCFSNKKQIKNHLKQIPKFCKISYKVTDCEYKDDPAYKIHLFVDSSNRLLNKYILTWIRTLFEYPYNIFLVHARKLKELPQFKFESIINLYHVVATAHGKEVDWKVHSFGPNLIPLTKKEIIASVGVHTKVNDVFPLCKVKNFPQCELIDNYDLLTEELFSKNLPIYLEIYNTIKNEHINNR